MTKLDINELLPGFFFLFLNSKTQQNVFHVQAQTEPARRLFIRMQPQRPFLPV